MKKIFAIGIAIVMMFVSIFSIISSVAGDATIHVDDNYNESTEGWGVSHFDTIQAAIDAANDDDTIIVHSGKYTENINVDKSLTLEGEGSPEVNGGGSGTVVTITGSNVEFSGFEVKNSGTGTNDAGIFVEAEGVLLEDNFIAGNNLGLRMKGVDGTGWSTTWEDETSESAHPNGMDIQDDEMVTVHNTGKILLSDAEDGDPVWSGTFKGGKNARGVAFDSNHNFAVVGGYSAGLNNDRWVIEYFDGETYDKKWSDEPITGGFSVFAYDVAFDSNDDIVAVGKGGNHHPTVYKAKSSDGDDIWQFNDDNGGQVAVGFWDVSIDSSNNIIAGGSVQGSPTQGKITKLYSSGTKHWDKTLGSSNSDVLGVGVDSGNNILAGVQNHDDGKVLLRKYDTNGNVKWTDTNFGSEENFVLYDKSISSYDSDKWLVSGYSDIKSQNVIYLIDSSGNTISKIFSDVDYKDVTGELRYDAENVRIVNAVHAGEGNVWKSIWEIGTTIPGTVVNNEITQNVYGVYLEGTEIEINHNDIKDNTNAVHNTMDTAADLQFNWWGHLSGPSGEGPGEGDSISENVDYSPWLGYVEGTSPMTFHTNDVIQDAVTEAAGGDTVIVYDGTYTEQVVIDKSLTMMTGSSPKIVAPDFIQPYTFDETGSTWYPVIFAYGGDESSEHVSGFGTITVSIAGFEIDGGNKGPATGRFGGILMRNVNSGVIDGNTFHSLYDADGKGNGPESFGIAVYGNSYVEITDNEIRDFSRGGIVVNGDGTYPDSIGSYPDPTAHIEGNRVYGNGLESETTWWAENGIQVGWAATGTIIDNEVYDCRVNNPSWAASGILTYYGVIDEISGNIVENSDMGIPVYYNNDGEIDKNEISENDYGFVIIGGTGNQLHHNTVENNAFSGMYLASNSNKIHHNTFDVNGEAGIFVDGSEQNNMHHNKFNVNDGYGIYLYYSDDNTVSKNHAFKNGIEGVCVEASDENQVTFNKAFSNDDYGIKVTDDKYWVPPTVDDDNNEVPGYWEIVETSDDNTIQHNVAHFNGEADIFDDTEGTNNIWSKNTYDESIPEDL